MQDCALKQLLFLFRHIIYISIDLFRRKYLYFINNNKINIKYFNF